MMAVMAILDNLGRKACSTYTRRSSSIGIWRIYTHILLFLEVEENAITAITTDG